MTGLTIPSSQVRVPKDARDAVAQHQPAHVLSHDRPRYVILHPEDYELVSPFLERRRQGLPVPVEQLLTADVFAILAEESAEDADIAVGILESWEQATPDPLDEPAMPGSRVARTTKRPRN